MRGVVAAVLADGAADWQEVQSTCLQGDCLTEEIRYASTTLQGLRGPCPFLTRPRIRSPQSSSACSLAEYTAPLSNKRAGSRTELRPRLCTFRAPERDVQRLDPRTPRTHRGGSGGIPPYRVQESAQPEFGLERDRGRVPVTGAPAALVRWVRKGAAIVGGSLHIGDGVGGIWVGVDVGIASLLCILRTSAQGLRAFNHVLRLEWR